MLHAQAPLPEREPGDRGDHNARGDSRQPRAAPALAPLVRDDRIAKVGAGRKPSVPVVLALRRSRVNTGLWGAGRNSIRFRYPPRFTRMWEIQPLSGTFPAEIPAGIA